MIWNSDIECMSREEMQALQTVRLKETVQRVYDKVPHYRQKLDAAGVQPEDIHTLEDIQKLPFTVKADMRDNYPYGLFAVPMKEIVRIHASSGTTGKPTVVGYTRDDLDAWAECMARLIVAAGGSADDTAQISFGYGLFTGAFGLHYGMEKIGASVIPISSGNTERQVMILKDFGATILICTPSYALYIAEMAEKMGLKKGDLKLKYGLFGGEGSTDEMRREIEDRLGIVATENYGLSEIMGPGVSGECLCKCGMHINEDYFYPEIINPETGEVLPEGATGELVLTTICKEGIPLLRYRTKDITRLIYEPCACGRKSVRMAKVQGRSDDMLIIRGVNVFPSQIESVLISLPEIGPHYEITVSRDGYLDVLEVKVELTDASMLDKFSELEELRKRIRHNLKTTLQIDAVVKLCEPYTLKRFEGKAKRVIDLRNKDGV